MMFSYSLSFPLESRQRRYMTLASTLAGLKVLGSLRREITDSSTVRTDCVGFQRSHGNSPDCGSSTGGCKIDMHRSPFCNTPNNIFKSVLCIVNDRLEFCMGCVWWKQLYLCIHIKSAYPTRPTSGGLKPQSIDLSVEPKMILTCNVPNKHFPFAKVVSGRPPKFLIRFSTVK